MKRHWPWVSIGALVALGLLCWKAALSRDTLWLVERLCLLDRNITGLAFPCLEIVSDAGALDRGVAILRAPLERTHIVVMPTVRMRGVEDPKLLASDSPNYFKAAWDARHYVQEQLSPAAAKADLGMAINSTIRRTQDQAHIHVDCVRRRIRQRLERDVENLPLDTWQPPGFTYEKQPYWVMRIEPSRLDQINLFRMAAEIPGFEAYPFLTNLAVLSLHAKDGSEQMLLLAGQADPSLGFDQSSSEDLLDHACRL